MELHFGLMLLKRIIKILAIITSMARFFFNQNYTKAISDFNTAIQLKPDYSDAYLGRGAVYMAQGKYNEAINDFEETLNYDPRSSLAFYKMD